MGVIVQKIQKHYKDSIELAIKYYQTICILNDLPITDKELKLLAFTAHRGTISGRAPKEEFARQFNSSIASVGNLIGKLKGMGLLEEVDGEYRVKKALALDFKQDLLIQLTLTK